MLKKLLKDAVSFKVAKNEEDVLLLKPFKYICLI